MERVGGNIPPLRLKLVRQVRGLLVTLLPFRLVQCRLRAVDQQHVFHLDCLHLAFTMPETATGKILLPPAVTMFFVSESKLSRLLAVDHPRDAVAVYHHSESHRPEGLLNWHFHGPVLL